LFPNNYCKRCKKRRYSVRSIETKLFGNVIITLQTIVMFHTGTRTMLWNISLRWIYAEERLESHKSFEIEIWGILKSHGNALLVHSNATPPPTSVLVLMWLGETHLIAFIVAEPKYPWNFLTKSEPQRMEQTVRFSEFTHKLKTKFHGLSPRANYTDRATAACQRSVCQLLRIEGATWSAWRIPTAGFSIF
jgi:predicted ABC-type exoprotein transport system permease subunit